MMLRFLRGNKLINLVVVPLWAFALWFPYLFFPEPCIHAGNLPEMPLMELIRTLKRSGALIPFLLILILSYLLTQFNKKHVILEKRTYILPLVFISLASPGFTIDLNYQGLIGALFVLWALDRSFTDYHKNGINTRYFDAAFAISAASLFYFNMLYFLPFVWIAIAVLRPLNLREPLSVIVGLILPYLFTGSYYFLLSDTNLFFSTIQENFLHHASFAWVDLADFTYLTFLLLLLVPANFLIITRYNSMKISTRKLVKLLLVLFLISLLIMLISSVGPEIFQILALPLSFLFAYFFHHIKNQRAGNVILLIFILIQFFESYYPWIEKSVSLNIF